MSQLFKVQCGSWALTPALLSKMICKHFEEMGAYVHLAVGEVPRQPMYLLFAGEYPITEGGGMWNLKGAFETLLAAQDAGGGAAWAHIALVENGAIRLVSVNYKSGVWAEPAEDIYYKLEAA